GLGVEFVEAGGDAQATAVGGGEQRQWAVIVLREEILEPELLGDAGLLEYPAFVEARADLVVGDVLAEQARRLQGLGEILLAPALFGTDVAQEVHAVLAELRAVAH